MADTTDVREWLKAQGEPVKDRGRIPAGLRERYEDAHRGADVVQLPGADVVQLPGADGDYDAGVTEADFIVAAPPPARDGGGYDETPEEPAAGGPDGDTGEARPRRVATAKASRRDRFTRKLWGGKGTPAKRPARQHKRMSLVGLAEDAFLDLAWTFQGLPPVEKVLYLQAPLAGQVVEDTFRGTAVDRVLQPVARADRQFKALEALTAPGWVFAIVARGRKDESGEYSPETKLMFAGLRHALLSMSRVADVDFETLKSKSEDLRSASGQIDQMIAWLFEMPELTEDEVAAMRAAQQAHARAGSDAG